MSAGPPRLAGTRLRLRPVQAADHPDLRMHLLDPTVRRWWGQGAGGDVLDEWLEADDDTTVWTIEVDGRVGGSIQASEETDPDYRHAGIDLFLGPAFQGRGLGPEAVRVVAGWLIDVRGHHRLTIDPSAANERAIRAYTAVGFRPVGVMRAYERGPDGTWHDGLLMDLLADQFDPGV